MFVHESEPRIRGIDGTVTVSSETIDFPLRRSPGPEAADVGHAEWAVVSLRLALGGHDYQQRARTNLCVSARHIGPSALP